MSLINEVTGENYRLRIWSNTEVPTYTIREIVKAVTNFFTWQFEVEVLLVFHYWEITFKWGGCQRSVYCLDYLELPVTANFIRRVAERIAIPIRRASQRHISSQVWEITELEYVTSLVLHEGEGSVSLFLDEIEQYGDRFILKGNDRRRDCIRFVGQTLVVDGVEFQANILEVIKMGDNHWFTVEPRVEHFSSVDYDSHRVTTLWTRDSDQRQQDVARAMADGRDFQRRFLAENRALESLRQGFEAVTSEEASHALANMFKPRAIGDTSCGFNAKSPYLRCTPNPCGPCENCSYYEKI